ncbi:MAG: arylsulfatase [Planctomycetes bacterium]|nr:arylsulfatase [Planctomycetota bacterium]
MRTTCALIGVCLAWLPVALKAESPPERPNIIYILADDLGYGDLSCYGQRILKTPNLDRMAAEGLRFTRHYAGSTVCAPSRCVLLTGLHTGHCRIRGNGPGQLRQSDLTFVEVLQRAGYRTGCFGKWGVGNPPPLDDPQRHGFDEFYGYINMYHAHNYFPEFLIRNGKKVPLRNRLYPDWRRKRTGPREGAGVADVAVDYAPKLIAEATLRFIRENADQPFFVYYALNIPHANNEGGGDPRIGRNGLRVPDWGPFAGKPWPPQEKGFARMMQYIDQDVGRILSLLKELRIERRTLVLFSSDNGPHQEGGHKVDFFDSNGPLRGWKRDLYEGGIRTPFIAWWPGHVPAGKTSDLISGFQDVFPTLLELAGVREIPATDGISMVPTLLGRPEQQRRHDHLYWEFYEQGGKLAVVKGHWKAVRLNVIRNPDGPIELYDLRSDVGEQHNIDAEHPDVVSELARIMKTEHTPPEGNVK